MGLSASQVRLLSLTSRQHSIEGEAQRVLSNKLRLSNESDRVYQKYLNALDATTLKTMQTNDETGAASWIEGSINNLLRYDAEEGTFGNVFYVQDISSGKLYIPEYLGNKYDDATDAMNFAEKFGVVYSEVDRNIDIVNTYENAVSLGWDTVLGPTVVDAEKVLNEYTAALDFDKDVQLYAQSVLNQLPNKGENGLFLFENNTKVGAYNSLESTLYNVMSATSYKEAYPEQYREIIKAAYDMISVFRPNYLESGEFTDVISEYPFHQEVKRNKEVEYTKLTAKINDHEYVTKEKETFSDYDLFVMLLNGGERSILYTLTRPYDEHDNAGFLFLLKDKKYEEQIEETLNIYEGLNIVPLRDKDGNIVKDSDNNTVKTVAVYDPSDPTTAGTSIKTLLNNAGFDSFGEAFTKIFGDVTKSDKTSSAYLAQHNLTLADIEHYKTYKRYKEDYESYKPDIEMVPDDSVKAKYYEEIYNSITSAGGWIGLSEQKCKNASWVSNMIKSSQVILTTWDYDTNMLSRTSASLNTNLKEVADQNEIERAGQVYEEELDAINAKDTRYDTRLSQLETQRTAITTEIDSLRKVINNNVEKTFKLYG